MEKYMNATRLKCLFISLCILSIFLSSFSFIYSFKIYFSTDQYNLWYFENIRRSWIQGPIISLEESATPCKNNNEFINQNWELTFEGCGYDFIQNCTIFQNGLNLLITSSPEIYPMSLNITKWKNKHYCAKRSNYNYFNMTLAENGKDCPTNFKKCGIIDSKYNNLCLPLKETCPLTVNDYRINYKFDIDYKGDSNELGNYTFGRNFNSDFIILESFVRRNPVCISYSTKIRDRIQKPFFRYDFSHECSAILIDNNDQDHYQYKIYDERILLLDHNQVQQIYKENSVYDKLTIDLRDVLQNLSVGVKGFLFTKNYPGIKVSCMKKSDDLMKSNFSFNENDLKKIQSVQAFLFCEFLCILFNGVFIVVEIVIFKFNWFRPKENKDDLIDLKYTLSSYRLVKLSIAIGYFIMVFLTTLVSSIYYYTLSKAIYEITNLFDQKDCLDFETYELLKFTCDALLVKKENYSGPLIFSSAYLIVYIITIWLTSRTLVKFNKIYSEVREMAEKEDNEKRNDGEFENK